MYTEKWQGFKSGVWQDEINVRDFIQQNYTEYLGDASFLKGATARTSELMRKLDTLLMVERQEAALTVCRRIAHARWSPRNASHCAKSSDVAR